MLAEACLTERSTMQPHPRPGHGIPGGSSAPSARRLVNRKRLGAALAALTAGVLIAACGGTGGTAAGTGTTSAGGAGGTVNWEWQLPTSWDPVTSSAGWDMHALGLVYAAITTLDPAAVKANIERGQAQPNSNIAAELSVVKNVVVNSPASFTLNLTQVDYQVPDLLAGKHGMIVSPAPFSHVTTI